MRLIKIESASNGAIYINAEDVSYFYYDKKNATQIILKSGNIITVLGDVSGKLSKLITTITNGGTSMLE